MGRGFPAKTIMTHKYVDTISLSTPALAGYSVYKFRANGIYDPDQTGAGHQPMGFDQMSALYNHWQVIGSKISYRIARGSVGDPAATRGATLQVATYLDDDTTAPISYSALLEQNRVRSYMFGSSDFEGNSDRTVRLTNKFSARKQFGTGSLAKVDLMGSASADPTEQSLFVLAYTSDSVTPQPFVVQVQIDYIVVWTEVKDITPS